MWIPTWLVNTITIICLVISIYEIIEAWKSGDKVALGFIIVCWIIGGCIGWFLV